MPSDEGCRIPDLDRKHRKVYIFHNDSDPFTTGWLSDSVFEKRINPKLMIAAYRTRGETTLKHAIDELLNLPSAWARLLLPVYISYNGCISVLRQISF